MKKLVAVTLCLLIVGITGLAQTSGKGTRPRVIVTDYPPKPEAPASTSSSPLPAEDGQPASVRKPPVLLGDKKAAAPSTTPTPAATPEKATEAPDEVIDDGEVIKVETNLVTIPVSVLDRDGRYLSGLQQRDFHIFEDGIEQKIEHFASVEKPFTVILLLDVSASTQFKITEIQDAAIAFVDQLRPNDRIMVMAFDEKVRVLTQPTNNRAQLRDAIRQVRFGGGTSLYEAVDQAINQELRNWDGRKAIVLFTDGVDTTSKKATYQSNVRDAEEVDAMIYPIRYDTFRDMQGGNGGGSVPRTGGGILGQILVGILSGGKVSIGSSGGGGSSRSEYEKGKRYLDELAYKSGGRKFEATNLYNLEAAFSGIAEELRRQYSIGYYPENEGQAGQRKQIKVRVDQQGAVVRAKNSYIVGDAAGGNVAQQPVKQPPTLKTPTRFPF